MYKDFKKSESLDTGFAGGSSLLWMFSGIVLGLLVGLGMYFFSNDRLPNVSMIDTLEKKIQKIQQNKPKNTGTSQQAQSSQQNATSVNVTQKPVKVEEKRKNKFSYYAVLPNLDVPIGHGKPIDTASKVQNTGGTVIVDSQNNDILAEYSDEQILSIENQIEEASPTASLGDYLLQVASFKKESMADKTRGRLSNKGIDAYVQKKKIKGRYWYRVVAGPVDQYSVDNWKTTAEKLGHKPLIISVR